jgi:uncharacterized membrane protein
MIFKIILGTLILGSILANFYIFKFQRSFESKDERGEIIQLKTMNSMYNITFLGAVMFIILNLLDILSAQRSLDFLLYFLVISSIFNAFILYRNRNKSL